jgi:DNA-binding response OmpR family regulator
MVSAASGNAPGEAPAAALQLRVMVVEDEFLVGLLLEEDLAHMGCTVLGPYRRLEAGIEAARSLDFDVALLDINLDGAMVYPLADELRRRGRPFLFLSGYNAENMPERFHGTPRLAKPHDIRLLARELRQVTQARGTK